MTHAIDFIETSIFTTQIEKLATNEKLRELQNELIATPEKGSIITGTGGLRKVRMAVGSQGKSGGLRVIYYLAHAEKIYLVLAYPKSEKDNLTAREKSELKELSKQLKGELK
ncbi:type II toxin-antitoxin system RelE/ParE family toxin [Idiomarina sp. Sol25]|uniref:type II toxin-antitoxin system RelE/ParE family toxin n=1 Tax=Idiomarina sp. Sol25 TaxID=3064000 RepID=UPI003982CC59